MTFAKLGQQALDYFPCRYGTSKLLFRGPRRRLQGGYVAFLGGMETYGRYMPTPYPALLEHETGTRSVNLGCVNAGIDAYINDRSLMNVCLGAKVTVIELTGAQNLSNRFYAVHPRRNDRFLRAADLLRTLYSDVDFTDFNFTRHMLTALAARSSEKFKMVRQELKDAWVARMRMLIDDLQGRVVLLWLANHAPGASGSGEVADSDPLFIDRAMLAAVKDRAAALVQVVATADEIRAGVPEMIFGSMEEPAAEEMLGPAVHRRVTKKLAPVLRDLV